MKKFLGLLIVGMLFCMSSYSQIIEPVQWKVSMQGEGNKKEIVFHAYIEDGWHLYATDISSGGPIPTSFSFDEISNVSLKGDVTPSKRPLHVGVWTGLHLPLTAHWISRRKRTK